MFFTTCLFIVLFVKPEFGTCHTCQALDNVAMLLVDKDGREFNKTVNGCIQRIEFGETTVVKAFVRDKQVLKLWRDTVRNMKYLTTVSFVNCQTDYIAPIAFRNVPGLKSIEVARGNVKEINRDIFTQEYVPKLEKLQLYTNEISYIEDKSFANLTMLKEINLKFNYLDAWRQEWFDNTPALQIMNFQFNKIRAVPRRAFADLPKLRQILFDHNDIIKIHRDAFKDIRSLEYLGLSHNKLTKFESASFPNTVRINSLTIHANYFNYLSNGVLQKLTAVKIVMDYNPWKCECLERINTWLFLKNGQPVISDECKGSHVPVCARSSDVCTDTVDPELTQRYIALLGNLSTPLAPSCAKFE